MENGKREKSINAGKSAIIIGKVNSDTFRRKMLMQLVLPGTGTPVLEATREHSALEV